MNPDNIGRFGSMKERIAAGVATLAQELQAAHMYGKQQEISDITFLLAHAEKPPAWQSDEYRATLKAARNRQGQRRFHRKQVIAADQCLLAPGMTVAAPDGRPVVVERSERCKSRDGVPKIKVWGHFEDGSAVSFSALPARLLEGMGAGTAEGPKVSQRGNGEAWEALDKVYGAAWDFLDVLDRESGHEARLLAQSIFECVLESLPEREGRSGDCANS